MPVAMQSESRACFKQAAGLIILLWLAACASSRQLTHEFLDTGTGVTVTSSAIPLVLYRDNPAMAAYARNFVHMGPIEVNRSGTYRYYLWVSAWNTMDTPGPDRIRNGFDAITIFADGEPMLLEFGGATPDAIGASRPVYVKPVASATDAYYPVTADQIRLIAEAREVRLRTSGSPPREYRLWDDQQGAFAGMRAFVDAALF